MDDLTAHPEFQPFIDPTAESVAVEQVDGQDYLVTVVGEDGGQLLLRKTPGGVVLLESDNVVATGHFFGKAFIAPPVCTGPCTLAQHAQVAQAIKDRENNFSTAGGPAGGTLACLWAVRHIVHDVLGFWITRSDGTAVFDPALMECFGASMAPDAVAPGGIIISPTSGSNIGHIGLLGEGNGDARLVYSNSSSAKMWKRNYTVGSWRARYQGTKGLPVHFFPLPQY